MPQKIIRDIQKSIEESLFLGKIIIIYGARQVGKTTLSRDILMKYGDPTNYYNCDEPDIRDAFTKRTSTQMRSYIGDQRLIVIDEAQRIPDIGLTLKLIVDTYPDIQIIATGSSSFDLANSINEPLTGRKYEFFLPAISVRELRSIYTDRDISRLLPERLVYGMYPAVIDISHDARMRELQSISQSYVYKDILTLGNIKNPDALVKLCRALALQIGQQVSYTELAGLVGIDKNTVETYIRILEQAYIIFRLTSYARNERNELKFSKKIYFHDIGIRNALIQNYNPVDIRTDTGHLWENFVISERQKYISNNNFSRSTYFWRNHAQAEIDYIEEYDGGLHAYEIKYGTKVPKIPKAFATAYPAATYTVIDRENFLDYVV